MSSIPLLGVAVHCDVKKQNKKKKHEYSYSRRAAVFGEHLPTRNAARLHTSRQPGHFVHTKILFFREEFSWHSSKRRHIFEKPVSNWRMLSEKVKIKSTGPLCSGTSTGRLLPTRAWQHNSKTFFFQDIAFGLTLGVYVAY